MTLAVHVKPYFLRLNFSHALLEDDESSAQYDPSSGYLTITMTKENKGQDFKDLDLLAKLLAPRTTTHHPVIEVLSSDNGNEPDMISKIQGLSLEENLSLEQEEIKKGSGARIVIFITLTLFFKPPKTTGSCHSKRRKHLPLSRPPFKNIMVF